MKFIKALLIVTFLLCLPSVVFAQDVEYRLDLRRDFGYGAGSNIRGTFTNRVFGPEENIASVTYKIDDQVMGVVSEPPFAFKYHTDDYPNGWHNMTAVVTTKDGREVVTPPVSANLLNSAGEGEAMRGIFVPLLVLIGAVTIIGLGSQFLMAKRGGGAKPGEPRKFGFKGGTICPRCGRAYPIHFMSINLLGGHIDRCDYCGKVAFVQRKSPYELEAAIASERAALNESEHSLPGAHSALSDEERAQKLLDDSRYTE